MALLSDLVRIVAQTEGLDEVSVGIFARHAREAGYIAQGGRGRSAAKMSIRDAANLLIAVNGCYLAKDVIWMVAKIRLLPIARGTELGNHLGLGAEGSTFGDDFERLLEAFANKNPLDSIHEVPGETFVRFYRPEAKADILYYPVSGGTTWEDKTEYEVERDELNPLGPDRSDETVISHRTLRAVARAL